MNVGLCSLHGQAETGDTFPRAGSLGHVEEQTASISADDVKTGGIRHDPIPLTDLDQGIIGWGSESDPEMPLNFNKWRKWTLVALLSVMTLVTPLASSILSPGLARLDQEFHNESEIVSAMTVSVYLLGYVIGPLFLAPLCEIYGRRPVLCASNIFFCLWLIGCALAPNIGALIAFRFLSGIGGAGGLVL